MTPLAAYILLFLAVGIGFIFVHLVAGKLIRPNKPNAEKGSIYECGEPTIGSAWVQFDLRFYVVALLFVIFDVEVAFFFPWAEVFGKANAIATAEKPTTAAEYVAYAALVQDLATPRTFTAADSFVRDYQRYENITGMRSDGRPALDTDGVPIKPLDEARLAELSERKKLAQQKRDAKQPLTPLDLQHLQFDGPLKAGEFEQLRAQASWLAWMALIEVLVFFGVLLVGFAYLWRRGDLEWVRSTAAERIEGRSVTPPADTAVRQTVSV